MVVPGSEAMLAFAGETLQEAGKLALKYFRMPVVVDNKAGNARYDPVTAADREIEEYIRQAIHREYPGHTVTGEEAGTEAGNSAFCWYIDPIDGTRAFISGNPLWGIMTGLMEQNHCMFGLIHQPFLQETFIGSSAGTYLVNGNTRQQIHTAKTRSLEDAILYSTHPSIFSTGEEFDFFNRVAGKCRMMRYGGDCYSYCLLAHGFIDLIIEADLQDHDIVPLVPIIEAAGGIITDWQGNNPLSGDRIIASANKRLHDTVLGMF